MKSKQKKQNPKYSGYICLNDTNDTWGWLLQVCTHMWTNQSLLWGLLRENCALSYILLKGPSTLIFHHPPPLSCLFISFLSPESLSVFPPLVSTANVTHTVKSEFSWLPVYTGDNGFRKKKTNWFNAFRHLSEDDGAKCDIFPFKLWHKYSQWCLLEDADVKVWRNMHVQIKLLQAKLDLCVQNVKLTKSTLKAKDDLAGFSPGNRCRVLQSCNIKTVMKYHQESRAPLWFFIASVSLVPFGTKCDTLEAGICDYLLPPCPIWASRWPWKREFLNAK